MKPKTDAARLISLEQVMAVTGYRRSWIYFAVREGRFPQPIRLSRRCTRWDSRAIDQWIERQLQGATK